MDKKSKALKYIFIVLTIALFSYGYNKLVIKHDYIVHTHTACDDTQYSCFKTTCAKDSGEDCEEEVYAKIAKNIKNVDLCDQYSGTCPDLTCEPNEPNCAITYCSEDNLEDGETCVKTDAAEGGGEVTVEQNEGVSTSTATSSVTE